MHVCDFVRMCVCIVCQCVYYNVCVCQRKSLNVFMCVLVESYMLLVDKHVDMHALEGDSEREIFERLLLLHNRADLSK